MTHRQRLIRKGIIKVETVSPFVPLDTTFKTEDQMRFDITHASILAYTHRDKE